MTSATNPFLNASVLPSSMPTYSFPVPGERVKLVSAKDMIYRPDLPSFRHMDRDSNLHRLSDEHCRTSTQLPKEMFRSLTMDLRQPRELRLHSLNLPDFRRQIEKYIPTPEELLKGRDEWSTFLNKCPERFEIKLPGVPNAKDIHYTGYAVRYVKPELTRDWTYKLKTRPHIDSYHQVAPLPIDLIDVHRSYRTFPSHDRNASSAPWKPPCQNYYRFV